MSRAVTEGPSIEPLEELSTPTAWLAVDAIQIAFVACLLIWLLLADVEVSLTWKALVLAGLVTAVWRSMGWIVLLAVQLSLLVREPSRPDIFPGIDAAIICVLVLFLVAYSSSLHTTRRDLRSWIGTILHWSNKPRGGRAGSGLSVRASKDRPSFDEHTLSLLTRSVKLLAVVLIAMLVFANLPIFSGVREQWWERSMANERTLWPGPNIFLLALVCVVLFSQSEWRQISPAQARLYVRTVFVGYHYRDLRMIILRRLKTARMRSATVSPGPSERVTLSAPPAEATNSRSTSDQGV